MNRYLRLRSYRKYLIQNILHVNDTPHRVALGVGVAVFVAFLPIVGIQTIVAVGLAALLGGNKAVCVPMVWITNPVTMIPIYSGCLAVGRLFAPHATEATHLSALMELVRRGHLFSADFWKGLFQTLANMGIDLWVGCGIVGVGMGVVAYFLSLKIVSVYDRRRRERKARRMALRAQRNRNRRKNVGHVAG